MKRIFYSFRNRITSRKEIVSDSLQKADGKKAVVDMRYKYENEELIKLVLDQLNFGDKALDQGDKIVPKYNPGYMAATSKYGRAHFYAPAKQLGNLVIDTYWFNMLVIWVLSILLYISLYFKIFRRILDSIENLNLRKPEV